MLFMVIETFKDGEKTTVYERFSNEGRMLPDGLRYINSWIEQDGNRCFQLMDTEREELFEQWIAHWIDLIDFEVVPVLPSITNQSTRQN